MRSATVQGIETLRSLLEAAADHMPHLSHTLVTGERVGLKVLPAGTEWKQFLASVNEVRLAHALGITHGFQFNMKDSSRPTGYWSNGRRMYGPLMSTEGCTREGIQLLFGCSSACFGRIHIFSRFVKNGFYKAYKSRVRA